MRLTDGVIVAVVETLSVQREPYLRWVAVPRPPTPTTPAWKPACYEAATQVN